MRRGLWLMLGGALAACGGSGTDPETRQVPPLGTYAFTMNFDDPTVVGPIRLDYHGSLVLTYADADSVAGYYQVPAMDSSTSLGFYNVDGYLLYGRIHSGSRIFAAKFNRRSNGLSCKGLIIYPGLSQPSINAPCSFVGPL